MSPGHPSDPELVETWLRMYILPAADHSASMSCCVLLVAVPVIFWSSFVHCGLTYGDLWEIAMLVDTASSRLLNFLKYIRGRYWLTFVMIHYRDRLGPGWVRDEISDIEF